MSFERNRLTYAVLNNTPFAVVWLDVHCLRDGGAAVA